MGIASNDLTTLSKRFISAIPMDHLSNFKTEEPTLLEPAIGFDHHCVVITELVAIALGDHIFNIFYRLECSWATHAIQHVIKIEVLVLVLTASVDEYFMKTITTTWLCIRNDNFLD